MIPVRLHHHERGLSTRFASVRSLEHAELCRAFNLDPATYHFDLPRSATSDAMVGAGSSDRRARVSGYLLRGDQPVGTIHVAREGEVFRDLDPEADGLNLQQTR